MIYQVKILILFNTILCPHNVQNPNPIFHRSYENNFLSKTGSLPDLSGSFLPVQDESFSQNVRRKLNYWLWRLTFVGDSHRVWLITRSTGSFEMTNYTKTDQVLTRHCRDCEN